MTIARRLLNLVAVPLLVLLGLGAFTWWQLAAIKNRTQFVAETQVKSLATLGNITRSLAEMRVEMRNFLLAADPAAQAKAKEAIEMNRIDLAGLQRQYADTLISDDQDRRITTEFQGLLQQWSSEADKIMSLAGAGQQDEARSLMAGHFAEIGARLSAVSAEWIDHNEALATTSAQAAMQSIAHARLNAILAIAIGLGLSGLLGFLTFRRIVNPIRALQTSVESIARGD